MRATLGANENLRQDVHKNLHFWVVGLLLTFGALLSFSQTAAFGTITGRVLDPTGAVIPNCKVQAENKAYGITRTVSTTSDGIYAIPNLPPGVYVLTAETSGFKVVPIENVDLHVGEQKDVIFRMSVADARTTIQVAAVSPMIESTKTDVSTSLTQTDIERLPVFAANSGGANDYANLAVVAPGVKFDTSTITNGGGLGDLIGPGSFNNRANLINVDGADIIDQVGQNSGRDGLGASIDEIQGFQVLTNNYNAEYGQAGGLILNVVTKSGSNSVHGSGYTYFRGRNLAASNFFYNLGLFKGTPRPGCKHVANGILLDTDGCPRAPFHRTEGGFTLGGPFIRDRAFWFVNFENTQQGAPLTLTPPSGVITVQSPVSDLLYSGKIDLNLNADNRLTARVNAERFAQSNATAQIGNNATPDSLIDINSHNVGLTVALVSTVTPNLVNDARVFRLRFISSTTDQTTTPGQQHANFYTGANFLGPQGSENKRYQLMDNLTWTRGAHTLKTGLNISYYPWFANFQQFHFGQYGDFDSADKIPSSFKIGIGPGSVKSKDNIYGFYVQDTWKINSDVTLNYGLRWDYEAGAFRGGPINNPNGGCFQGNHIIAACSSDKNNFQPRVGVTYSPRFVPSVFGGPGRTLIKGSFAEVTVLAYNNVVLDSLNFDGLNLFTAVIDNTTAAGRAVLSAFPNAPSATLLAPFAPNPAGPFGSVRPIASNLKNPEMRMVNVGIQREFGRTFVAEIQYLGQFGYGIFGERDTNYPNIIADPAQLGFFYFGARPNPLFTNIRTNENSRTSHYNGLIVSATKRMAEHVQFQASYTLSHLLDSADDFFGLSEPGDPRNVRADLGPALNDSRHAANFGVVLNSGRWVQGRAAAWMINNLGLSFVGQLQSGRPYQVSTGAGPFSGERFFGTGNDTQQRPSILPDGTIVATNIASSNGVNLAISQSGVAACQAAGFPSAQCAALQTTFLAPAGASSQGAIDSLTHLPVDFKLINGDLERNAGLSPAYYRLDTSIAKSFGLIPNHENIRIEFRADFFNVFNHTNLFGNNANPSVSALALPVDPVTGSLLPNFFNCISCLNPVTGQYIDKNGRPLNIRDFRLSKERAIQDIQNPNFGGLGDPSIADIARTIQLSFHVRF